MYDLDYFCTRSRARRIIAVGIMFPTTQASGWWGGGLVLNAQLGIERSNLLRFKLPAGTMLYMHLFGVLCGLRVMYQTVYFYLGAFNGKARVAQDIYQQTSIHSPRSRKNIKWSHLRAQFLSYALIFHQDTQKKLVYSSSLSSSSPTAPSVC